MTKTASKTTERHTVTATLDENGLSVQWQAYLKAGAGDGEYLANGESVNGGILADLAKCAPCASGWVKWDGCADFDLSPSLESYEFHTCHPGDVMEIIEPIQIAYELAAQLMPDHAYANGWGND